jgi:hypothetical protein
MGGTVVPGTVVTDVTSTAHLRNHRHGLLTPR